MLLMDRNFNPFAILNKQGYIINGNQLCYDTVPFTLTQVTLLQFFSHTKELLII